MDKFEPTKEAVSLTWGRLLTILKAAVWGNYSQNSEFTNFGPWIDSLANSPIES